MSNSINEKLQQAIDLLGSTEVLRNEEQRASALKERFLNKQLTVSVIGQFKRGKSSLVNAILGETLLPTGIVPVTSAITVVKYGEKAAIINFENGLSSKVKFEELTEYVNEQQNPNNERGVASVTIYTESDFLKSGITFVDTPGVGSVHKHNTVAAYDFVRESDAIIFMLSVDSPINEIEIQFLENASEYASKFYYAVNKIDVVDEEDLSEYLAYCSKLIGRLMNQDKIMIFPVSAKKNKGVDALKKSIQTDCMTSAAAIMAESARMKLIDILDNAISRTDFYWNALSMPVGKLDYRYNKLLELDKQLMKEAQETAQDIAKMTIGSDEEAVTAILKGRRRLEGSVRELFGMELKINSDKDNLPAGKPSDKYLNEIKKMCTEVEETINKVLLYKEDDAIIVANKIDDLNKLVKKLRRLKANLNEA